MSIRALWVCAWLLVILTVPWPVWSQESRGVILGRITDSSGSVVPGVAVEITNIGTNVTNKTESNGEGNYFSAFLIPGMYRITAEKAGFKRAVRSGIEVNVNARLELNLTVELGTLTETVTVTGEAPLLDTTSASVGQVVDARQVRELPMQHGNPNHLIRMASGVAYADNLFAQDQPWQTTGNTGYAMAGSRSQKAEFTLDGASNTNHDPQGRGDMGVNWTPPSDAVAEFKVQTAVFDASTGQTEGGVVNVSLKSGSNKFHGSAYWGKQAPSMNANLFFANLAGTPRGNFNYDRWGGTFSGPVIIPKVYNGRNRTFFLFVYEGIHSTTPVGTVATVPTAAERNGDFSALLKVGANYQIYDPFTRTAAAGGRFTNQPVPGNIIPPSLLSPIAKNILSFYPMPDATGGTVDGGSNLNRSAWPSRIPYHTHLYKFDQVVSDKNRLMFRSNFYHRDSHDTDYFGFDNPSLGTHFWNESAAFAADDVHSFSATFLMDIRVSDSRYVRAQDASEPGQNFHLTSLGFPASIENAIDPAYRRFPAITLNGYTALGARTPLFYGTETRNVAVTFDKIVRGHDVKFGGEYRLYPQGQNSGSSSTALQLTFNENYTRGPLDNSPTAPIGQALASMLYGIATGGTLTLPSASDFYQSSNLWAGFVQDNWKLTRKLTVTLGLRYEYEGALRERYNRSVRGFDSTATLPFAAQVKANYALNPTPEIPAAQFQVQGGLTFAGLNGQPRNLYEPDTNNFMPRLGFSYSLGPKTVVRGGYGVYFGSLGARRMAVIQTGFIQNTVVNPTLDGGLTFAATMANPFPNGLLQPTGAAGGAMTNIGNSISYFNPNPAALLTQKYQVDIQREFRGRLLLDVGYQGSRGRQLEVSRTLSALPNQYLSTSPFRDTTTINYLSANLPNPFNIAAFAGTGRVGTVIARSALLAPNPQFTGISYYTSDGFSWYDALNVKVEKRFTHGYTFQTSYTWSKFIEATSLLNPGDADPAKVISDQDFPHHLAVGVVWELPFGRGRKFLSSLHRISDTIVGGWELSGIYTAQSGQALGFGDAILNGTLKDVVLPEGERTRSRYFNTSVFNTNSSQQLASHLRNLSARFNGIRADGYNYLDTNLLKTARIAERAQFEFRFEALNLFNHVTFANPNTTLTSTSFGTVTAQRNLPRRMQISLRVTF
ncbi:MAG: TonB-dependent receptor [Candidatus Solibacter sp.]|nr:TonB-dependent receptor [Candidatus Solibacter sp.]